MTKGREILASAWFDEEWLAQTTTVISYSNDEFAAKIALGAPDRDYEDGATLFWTDFVANDWTEHYSDLGTAVARLAVLIKSVEEGEYFSADAPGFVRWSDNLFTQTITRTPKPIGGTS